MKQGYVHSFESFGTLDGPGIRFVIFLQGCPLRCLYCHNPDSWQVNIGKQYSSDELVSEVSKYKNYLQNGGVTLSGGEPLVQLEFITELLSKLKEAGFHTAIDTSGALYHPSKQKQYDALLEVTDLFLLDIKHIDNTKHKELTSVSNTNTLEFAKYLSKNNKKMWIRYVLVPGLSDDKADLVELRKFIDTLNGVEKVEILPYHKMGIHKYEELGLEYPIPHINEPSQSQIDEANEILGGVRNE